MATSPYKRFARALAVGLTLAGATFVGLTPVSVGHASAHVGAPAFEAPPPPPDPVPVIDKPANPEPTQAPPPRHRRHIDGDPVLQR